MASFILVVFMLFTYVKADVTGANSWDQFAQIKKIHKYLTQKNGFATIRLLGHVSATSSSKTCSDVNNLLDIAVALLYNDRGYNQAFTQQVRI